MLLKSAKGRAQYACEHEVQYNLHFLVQVRTKARQLNMTIPLAGGNSLPSGNRVGTSTTTDIAAATTMPQRANCAPYAQGGDGFENVTVLSFSVAIVQHIIRRCRLQEPGEPFHGCIARVSGVRRMGDLNGVLILLQHWIQKSQRYIVQMPDGSIKSIRQHNVDKLTIDEEYIAVRRHCAKL